MVEIRDSNGRTEVKCAICGFKFDSILVEEERMEGYYDTYKVKVLRPVGPKDNPPHLVKDYICDKCYRHLGNAVKDSLIKDCDKFVEKSKEVLEQYKEEYLKKVHDFEEKVSRVKEVGKYLKQLKNLSDMSREIFEELDKNRSIYNTYFLDTAYKKDIEEKRKLCTIYDWEMRYNLQNCEVKYSKDFSRNYLEFVTLEDWRKLLINAEITKMSIQDICNLLKRIDEDIKKQEGG